MSSREDSALRSTSGGTVHTETSNPALLALLREKSAGNLQPGATNTAATAVAASPLPSQEAADKDSGETGAEVGDCNNSAPVSSETTEPTPGLAEGGDEDVTASPKPLKASSVHPNNQSQPSPDSPTVPESYPIPAGRSISQTIIRDDPSDSGNVSYFLPSDTDSASSELARLVGTPSRKSFLLSAAISEAGSSEEEDGCGGDTETTIPSADVTHEQSGDSTDRPDSHQASGGHASSPSGLPAAAAAATAAGGSESASQTHAAPAPRLGPAAPSPDLTHPQHQRFVTPYVSRRLKDQPAGRGSAVSTASALRERSALNVPKDQAWSAKQAAKLKTGGEVPKPADSQDKAQPVVVVQALAPASSHHRQEDPDPDLVDSLDLDADQTPTPRAQDLPDQTADEDDEDDEDTRRSSTPVPLEKGTSNLSKLDPPGQPETSSKGESEQNRSTRRTTADPGPQRDSSHPNGTVVTPGGREAGALPLSVESGGPSPSSSRRTAASILKKGRGERAPSSDPSMHRVYVDSPTFTREEEEEYRFVSSRVENHDEDPPPSYPTFRGLDQQAVSRMDNGEPVDSRANSRPFKQVRYQDESSRYENRDVILRHGRESAAEVSPQAPSRQFVLKSKTESAEVHRGGAPPPVKSLSLPPGPTFNPAEEEELEKEKTYQQELRGRVDTLQRRTEDTFVPRLTLNTESEEFRDSLDIPEDVELDSERNRPPRDSLDAYDPQRLQQAMQDTRWDDPPTPPPVPPPHHQGRLPPPQRQGGYGEPQRGYGEGPEYPQEYRQPQRQGYADPHQKQGYADPQRQGYADPQRQGYADPQRQGYADPQRQGYADPQRQGYADPQRQGYADPHQRQGYADPQRQQGYADPHRQGYSEGYADRQRQGYGNPQRQGMRDGYADSQRRGLGDPRDQEDANPHRQGYGEPPRQQYSDLQEEQDYGDYQRQRYADPQREGYSGDQRQAYQANPARQGYGNPPRQAYRQEQDISEDQGGYADSYRAGYGQGYPESQGYTEKENYSKPGGYADGFQKRREQQQRPPPQPGYRAGPQMLGLGDFQGEGYSQRNGYAESEHPGRYYDSNGPTNPGSNHVTPRVGAGQRQQQGTASYKPATRAEPGYSHHPPPQQGGYYAQETEPPSSQAAGSHPQHQRPFPQDRKPYPQDYAERLHPPQQQQGYSEASPQDGYYLTEPRGYTQQPGYGPDLDMSDFGHQSAHAPQPAKNGSGDDTDRYKVEDGSSQNSTARESIPLPKPERDYIAQNKVSYGRPAKHSYKKLHTLKKEEEEKLNHVFVQPKGKGQKGSGSTSPSRYPAIAENPVEGDDQGAEELWAHRSASLARAKTHGGGKKRGSNAGALSRNNSRMPATNNNSSSGSISNSAHPPPPPSSQAPSVPPAAVRPMPNQQVHQGSPPQSSPLHHQVALAPVSQQLVTEDGQRISVDVNLRLISPPLGSQAEEGAAPFVGNQRLPGRQYPLEKAAGIARQHSYDGMEYRHGRYSADDVLSSKALDGGVGESYDDDGIDYSGSGYTTNPYKKIPPIPTSSEAPRSAPVQSEGSYMLSYLREKEKTQKSDKPWYRVYGLKDYKRMQKEVRLGTLGPDLDNDSYKERRERWQRQMEYAKSVKDKNTRELPSKKPPPFPRSKETDDMYSKRKMAIDYAKNVPKPTVKPRPNPFNNYEMASKLSPIAKPSREGQLPPASPHEPSVDILDLDKLHERHQQDKRNAEVIRQKAQGVLS